MKQTEIDKELRAIVKLEAKQRSWKSVGGTAYWTIGPLFFVLLQLARAKEGAFFCSLRFKWLELDKVLWRVLDMSSNEAGPFSLHANGAFVLSGQEIFTVSNRALEWLPGALAGQVKTAIQQASAKADEVASQIGTIESYLAFVQREHAEFMQRYPQAVINVWKEVLLVAMFTGDHSKAAEIARSRIVAGDSGGFVSGGRSFFERALAICEA